MESTKTTLVEWPSCQSPSYRAVVLSPHLDDAVFSCGGRITQLAREGRVLVVNFFTVNPPDTVQGGPKAHREDRIREEKDAAACLGFESIDLQLTIVRDEGYRNPASWFGDFLASDLEYLQCLAHKLETFLSHISFDILFIPLGIGWHIDHRMVFYAARNWWRDPRTFFYEDVPYNMISHATAYRLREIGYVDGTLAAAGASWGESVRAGWALSRMEPIQKYPIPFRWGAMAVIVSFWVRHMVRHRERWKWQKWGGSSLIPHIADISGVFKIKTEAAYKYSTQINEFFPTRESWWNYHRAYGTQNISERYWRMENAPPERPITPTQISVAMVTDDFLPAHTGAGMHVQKISQELNRRGFKVIILTSRQSGQSSVENWNGIKVYRFLSWRVYGFSQAFALQSAIRKILIENSVEIIHYHYLSFLMLQVLAVAKFMRVRMIYTAHMSINLLLQPFYMKPLRSFLIKLYLGLCENFDDIICVSAAQVRHFQLFNIRSRVHMISNPIDFTGDEAVLPSEPEKDFVVLYTGRLSTEKNVGYLLQAFGILAKSRPKVKLKIAGKGIEEGRLRRQVKELGLRDHVFFLGHVPHHELPALYQSSSVFVLPSLSETQGIVALEAMCFKRPVIVTNRIVPAKELVNDGENGFIVDPVLPEDLADRLRELYDNPELIRQMGQAGYEKSRGVTSDFVGAQLEQLYVHQTPVSKLWDPQNQSPIERRKTCVVCKMGDFEDSAGNLSLASNARMFQDDFFAVWRCSVCLSIHSLPKVPLDDYYKNSPARKARMNPYIHKALEHLQQILTRQGLGPSSKILMCMEYSVMVEDFFKKRGYEKVEGISEMVTETSAASWTSGLYDAVILDVYLEQADDPRIVLAWANRILKTKGRLLVFAMNAAGIELSRSTLDIIYQPYRIHLFSRAALESLARTSGFDKKEIRKSHYFDTFWPFTNERAMNYVSAFVDHSEESAWEFRPVQMFRKPWLIPWFFVLGLFGGIVPNDSYMSAVFEKNDSSSVTQ